MKQKNKRMPRNKTNSINSNKAESNVGNGGKMGSNTKSSCDFKKLLCIEEGLKRNLWREKICMKKKKKKKILCIKS